VPWKCVGSVREALVENVWEGVGGAELSDVEREHL